MPQPPLARRTPARRSAGTLGLTAVVALTAAACGGGDDSSGGGADGGERAYAQDGTFVYAVDQDPGALDPHLTALTSTRAVTAFAYDQLVHTDEDGETVSGLAESWDVTGSAVTYTLREDVTCSDGSPLTATDVAANFTFVADPENASPVLGLYVPPGVTAEADDTARTVTLTAAAPDQFLLQTTGSLPILCRKGIDDRSSLAQATDGTGPYVLEEVVANDHYTFTRRDGYTWGPDGAGNDEEGVPKTVTIRIISNTSTATNLLLSGEVQLANVGDAEVARAEAAGLEGKGLAAPWGEMWFNQAPGRPGADQAVRQALVGALDKEELGTVLTGGQGVPSKGLLTLEPRVCDGDTVTGSMPSMSVEEAGAMLDEAGWAKGAGGTRAKDGTPLAFTFLAPSTLGDNGTPGAELLAETWERLGATVKIVSQPDSGVNEALFATGDWDAGFVPLTVTLPTQYAAFVSGPTPPDGTNFAHIENEEYAAATQEAASATELDAACASYEEGEKALIEQADVAPIVNKVTMFFANGAEFDLGRDGLAVSSLRRLAE